jgi:acetylornithine/succinyldiaminopimelate/putrescine aminotransferase
VLRMAPAMNIAKPDVDEALRVLDHSLATVTQRAMATV